MSHFLAKPQRFLIQPAPGWIALAFEEVERVIASPLQKYKFQPIVEINDGSIEVSECDYRQALELLARLTLDYDLEWMLHSARVNARSEWPHFFEKSGLLDLWTKPKTHRIHVSASVTHPVVGTEKDVRQFACDALGIQNESNGDDSEQDDAKNPRQRIRIECLKNRNRIYVSLAGDPLFRRHYKAKGLTASAPVPEHIAAACFTWSQRLWPQDFANSLRDGSSSIVVPFAGTGTTGFESVARLLSISPGLTRKHFACEDFSFHPDATLATIRKRLSAKVEAGHPNVVFGDIHQDVLSDLSLQLESFKGATSLELKCDIRANDFLTSPQDLCDTSKGLYLPLNPPYGRRLAKETGSVEIYQRLGRSLKELSQTKTIYGYVICPDEDSWSALSKMLLHMNTRTCHFSHGGHDTRLLAFGPR